MQALTRIDLHAVDRSEPVGGVLVAISVSPVLPPLGLVGVSAGREGVWKCAFTRRPFPPALN